MVIHVLSRLEIKSIPLIPPLTSKACDGTFVFIPNLSVCHIKSALAPKADHQLLNWISVSLHAGVAAGVFWSQTTIVPLA